MIKKPSKIVRITLLSFGISCPIYVFATYWGTFMEVGEDADANNVPALQYSGAIGGGEDINLDPNMDNDLSEARESLAVGNSNVIQRTVTSTYEGYRNTAIRQWKMCGGNTILTTPEK